MKNKIIQKILTVIFFTGLAVVLKVYFDTPVIAIVFLLVFAILAGLIRVLVFGFVNPPDWLYRIRFTVLGIGYGIFIGALLFGMEAIENNTFIVQDLLKFILIGSVIGGIFNNTLSFSKSQKLERKKGLFLLERQLIKDFAQLINPDGESINGKLVLTNDNLVFLANGTNEKVLEKSIRELNPVINTMKFPGIPNGFKINNDEIIFKVPFPGYWIKRIEKRKQIKMAT
jgi:hypothetical protein